MARHNQGDNITAEQYNEIARRLNALTMRVNAERARVRVPKSIAIGKSATQVVLPFRPRMEVDVDGEDFYEGGKFKISLGGFYVTASKVESDREFYRNKTHFWGGWEDNWSGNTDWLPVKFFCEEFEGGYYYVCGDTRSGQIEPTATLGSLLSRQLYLSHNMQDIVFAQIKLGSGRSRELFSMQVVRQIQVGTLYLWD